MKAPFVSVAISPDGQTLASGSDDYTIKLWNLKTGDLLHTLTGHENMRFECRHQSRWTDPCQWQWG